MLCALQKWRSHEVSFINQYQLDIEHAETNNAICRLRYITMSETYSIVGWQKCETSRSAFRGFAKAFPRLKRAAIYFL